MQLVNHQYAPVHVQEFVALPVNMILTNNGNIPLMNIRIKMSVAAFAQ